jgi:BlaI family transcriptional regulator, penicillinase repressor
MARCSTAVMLRRPQHGKGRTAALPSMSSPPAFGGSQRGWGTVTKDFVYTSPMPPTASPFPTASELEILQVIWQRGPSTVREVYRTLSAHREIGYSTVLKFMQIMTEKGTLVRDGTVRPQLYRAAKPQRQVPRGIVRDLVTRAFAGSSASLAMQALSDRRSTADERRQIRDLLDALDRETKPGGNR